MLVDPDGRVLETLWDLASLYTGAISLANNLIDGNYQDAAIDAGGIILDAVATASPGIPGGAGAAIKAGRSVDKGVDAATAAKRAEGAIRDAKYAKETNWYPKNYRQNKVNESGIDPKECDVHHIFPKKHEDKFKKLGIDINDPKNTKWMELHKHRKGWKKYNDGWDKFFDPRNPNKPTKESAVKNGKELTKEVYK